jgi:Zn-dependent protease with chaperone function
MFDRLGWAAFLLALIPAVVRLPRTRSLLRHINDPALPERMTGSRKLMAFAFSVIGAAEVALSPRHLWWSIPVMIVTFALAGWPLRRALFAETWSFVAYLWFYVRLILAIYGFWIALMWSQAFTGLEGRRGWAITVAWCAVLLAWNTRYGHMIRFILRTKPVTSPSLVDRFANIIAKTTVTPPNVEYVDMRGGVLVNALALPGVKRPAVLFTSTLLERFDEDEIVAIFAHEVAHLEHYNPAYLRRRRWIGWLLIISTVAVTPLVKALAPGFEPYASWWPLVVLLYIVVTSSKKQKHETESDLRAVALTGEPEIMIRALVKLHELMRLPRRLDPSVEVAASHPSLARRIQAIRNASGSASATLPEPIGFRHESTSVTLHADRLVWTEGDVTAYTLAYSSLDELRIDADGNGVTRLVASDPAGRKWTIPLAAEDVTRAHTALNLVDLHLRPAPADSRKWWALTRWAAVLAAMFAISSMQFAAVIVYVLAAIAPERPLLRAGGVAGLAGALMVVVHGEAALRPLLPFLVLPSVLLLFLSYRDKRDVASRTAGRLVGLIGVLALLLAIPILLSTGSWLTLHQAARNWPGLAVMSIAFAAAVWQRRSAAWRTATAAAIAIAVTTFALGTTRGASVLVTDPFFSHAAQTEALPVPLTPDSRFRLGLVPEDILLSPNTLAIAAVTEDDDEENVFHVGRPGKSLTEVKADAGVFVDDDRLLLIEHDRDTTHVSLVHADHPEPPLWTTAIRLSGATLSIAGDARSWQLLGTTGEGEFQRVIGTIDGTVSPDATWSIGKTHGNGQLIPLVAADAQLLVHKATYDRHGITLPRTWTTLQQWIDPWRAESRFIGIDHANQREILHSRLDVDCALSPIIGEDPICWGYDGSRTHLFTTDVDGNLTAVAMLPHQRISVDATRGWIAGWGKRPYAFHVRTRRLYEVDYARGFLVADGDYLGVVKARGESSNVELYRINAR